jgi:hypothetical protein
MLLSLYELVIPGNAVYNSSKVWFTPLRLSMTKSCGLGSASLFINNSNIFVRANSISSISSVSSVSSSSLNSLLSPLLDPSEKGGILGYY